MSKITLQVVGDRKMNCGGCEGSVRANLIDLPGVSEVVADRNTQRIEVMVSSEETGVAELSAQLEIIGYQVAAL